LERARTESLRNLQTNERHQLPERRFGKHLETQHSQLRRDLRPKHFTGFFVRSFQKGNDQYDQHASPLPRQTKESQWVPAPGVVFQRLSPDTKNERRMDRERLHLAQNSDVNDERDFQTGRTATDHQLHGGLQRHAEWQKRLLLEVEFSYPHEKNGISLLMPVMHRKKTLFLVFQPFTWLLLVTGKIIISLTILLTDKSQQKSLSESALYVFSCFLGYPYPRFHSKRFIIKFQIITFVVGSIILRTAFQCFLISCFIKSSPVHQINTITQLQNSDVKIYMSQLLAPLIPEDYDLHKRFVYVTREERMVMLHENLNTSGAYGMIWTYANKYGEILNKGQRNILFYGMKEVLVPQYNSYMFKKHSPFLDKFSECLLRERQYMLAKSSDFGTKFKKSSLEKDEEVVLKLQHLQHIFFVLVFGLAASFLMFVVELIFFTWCVRIQVVL
jgi:hypothetical protein